MCFYLYVSASVAMMCLGHILSRSSDVQTRFGMFKGPYIVLLFLVIVKALRFLVV